MNRASIQLTAIVLSLGVTTTASAREAVVQAVQIGRENIRYDKGQATLELVQSQGAVQIVPLGKDHGSYVFGVAVLNTGHMSANFDVPNVSAQVGGQQVAVFTVDQLMSRAKSRATWTTIGLAVLGGVGSALSASQRSTYRSNVHSRYGSYRASFSGPSIAGQLRAQQIQADTAFGIGRVQAQLDETRAQLGDEIVQRTTVDPGDSYAGKIILDKVRLDSLPQRINLTVDWNGERYDFSFQVAPSGTAAPVFTQQAVPSRIEARAVPAILKSDDLPQQPLQPVAMAAQGMGRPARDVIAATISPSLAYSAPRARIVEPVPAAYASAPVALSGGMVEVPYQAASWASSIDPATRRAIPNAVVRQGGIVEVR